MLGSAVAAGFPAVHPFSGVDVFVGDENGGAGFEEIFFGREEIVGGGEDGASEAFGGQVDQIGEVRHGFKSES
jgi:hypothetical protein